MQQLICVIGSKGGTGKTSISHMLCHGLGLLGWHSISILTDIEREPLSRSGRHYVSLDGRTPEQLEKILEKLDRMPDWLGVIDGGGNRPDFDRYLYELGGLVLLPFRDSHEDMRTVRRDLERFPNAFGIPSQWPTNAWQQMAAERSLDEVMQSYRPRLFEPVYAVSASKLLLQSEVPGNLPGILNNVSRSLARQVLDRLGLPYTPNNE
jgi:cellulose biosynthesis protein BcsQ